MWQILFPLFLQLIAVKRKSEKNIKIGPSLPKLSQKDCVGLRVFLTHESWCRPKLVLLQK